MFSLLQLQWKQDLDLGLELISKAIEIDNKCDFAYETMGTIEVQRWDLQLDSVRTIDCLEKKSADASEQLTAVNHDVTPPFYSIK